ncbi:hypothetical protein M406DRAFT_65979 [Cryphonectria parasitica EP155]|uniref:Cell wall protein n=1 Tax=Cryphonectria parasitica (strain ATCC 38755 / EP155) TaxID=660469 RepID=A0A9P5CTB7_CRYP1|nr:uncharacterized protein M406DRAFT_65979 [Cryphonectria parasitica EP155]KAF3769487.1 hypothetical protein M406DRAFT_65979 [Cryphonectria parasitica EP155]
MRTSNVIGSLLATMVMAAGVQGAPVNNQRDLDTLDARAPQLTGIVDALEDAFKGVSSASKGLKTSKTTEKEAQSSSSSGSGGETVSISSVDAKRSPQLTGIVDALEDAFKGVSSASKGLKTSKTTEKEAQSSSSSSSGGETVSIPSVDVKRQLSGIVDALEDAFKGVSTASKGLKTAKTTEKEAQSSTSSSSGSSTSGSVTAVIPSVDI